MVETDICDYRQYRIDDIGAVEPSSKSCFDYCDVHFHVFKIFEGHCGGQFKERRTHRLEELSFFFYKVYDILLAHHSSVHPNALPEIHNMVRCLKSHLVANRLKQSGDKT